MTNVLDLFADPDVVGESEYRSIYNLLADVLPDTPENDRTARCRCILEEFRDSAEAMLGIIDKNMGPPNEEDEG